MPALDREQRDALAILVEDDLLDVVMQLAEQKIFAQWCSAPSTEEREELHARIMALDDVKRVIKAAGNGAIHGRKSERRQ